jgi:uncharacterized protein (DUF1697 family)
MRHVALVRGVNNIGMAKRVAMADLRSLFEDLGFRGVRTLLNSGNVVFSARGKPTASLASRIEKALATRLRVSSAVTLLSAEEVAGVVRKNPLAGVMTDPSRLLVLVPREKKELRLLKPLLGQRWAPEALALGPRVAYLWCASGVPRSPVWAAADRALVRSGTVRNLATFTRILRAMDEGAPTRLDRARELA